MEVNTIRLKPLPFKKLDFSGRTYLFDPNRLQVYEPKIDKNGISFSPLFQQTYVGRKAIEVLLNLTYGCNLRCIYCSAGENADHGRGNMMMDFETAKTAIDYFLKTHSDVQRFYFHFFGGEPLLNFASLKQIVDYINNIRHKMPDKEIFMKMTTNGSTTDESVIKFLCDNIDKIIVSLDGPEKVHNKQRPSKEGGNSYILTKNFVEKVNKWAPDKLIVQFTIFPAYITYSGYVTDLVKYFLREGVKRVRFICVHYYFRHQRVYTINEPLIEMFANSLHNFTEWYIDKINHDNHLFIQVENFMEILFNLITSSGICRRCGAGVNRFAVNPLGEIYACENGQAYDIFHIGSIRTGLHKHLNDPSDVDLRNFNRCLDCWLRSLCSLGGCPVFNFIATGSPDNIPVFHYCKYKYYYVWNSLKFLALINNSIRRLLSKIALDLN